MSLASLCSTDKKKLTAQDEDTVSTPDVLKTIGLYEKFVLIPKNNDMSVMTYYDIIGLPINIFDTNCYLKSFDNPPKYCVVSMKDLYLGRDIFSKEKVERYTQVYGYNWDEDAKYGDKSEPEMHHGLLMREYKDVK